MADGPGPPPEPRAAAGAGAAAPGGGVASPPSSPPPVALTAVGDASKMVSVSVEFEASHSLELGATAAAPNTPWLQLRRTGSVTVSAGGGSGRRRSTSAPTNWGGRMRQAWAQGEHIWWGLPTACKLCIAFAVVNAVLALVYVTVGLLLPTVDEEVHISITILITSLFVVFTVADAVIYENTLELATSIMLDTLILARVIWFAAQGTANLKFKVAWCTLMSVVQVVYIVVGVLAYRQFGWRLYSKLGVDYREKGAAHRMRLSLMRNGYITLLKINFMLLVVLAALGIDISIEKRKGDVQEAILAISLVGLAVGLAATWVAARLLAQRHAANPRLLLLFHLLMPLVLGHPVAVLAIYTIANNNVANATTSLNVGCVAYMVTSVCVWVGTQWMVHMSRRALLTTGGNSSLSSSAPTSVLVAGDPLLAAMHAGAWLGKPTQRNQRKIRFFQLSHDGSTLRWGWNKFVRLYYVDDLTCNDDELTLTLAFPFDAELVLKFPDSSTYQAWRRGLAHLLLMLMAPDAPHTLEQQQQQASGAAGSGSGLFRSGSSKGLAAAGGAAAGAAEAGGAGMPTPSGGSGSGFRLLQQLGVSVQELGKRVTPKRWQQQQQQDSAERQRQQQRRRSGSEKGLDQSPGGDCLAAEESGYSSCSNGQQQQQLYTPSRSTEQLLEQQQQQEREQHESQQQQKRQRMAAYLQTVASAKHPSLLPPSPPPMVPPLATTPLPPQPRRQQRTQQQQGGLEDTASSLPVLVSVGVQTEESALQQLRAAAGGAAGGGAAAAGGGAAYSSTRRRSSVKFQLPAEPVAHRAAAATAADVGTAAAPTPVAASPDADIAAQYMEAMQQAAAAAQQQQQQQQQGGQMQGAAVASGGDGSGGGDADLAAQYMAAMMQQQQQAAAAVGAAAQSGRQQQQQELQQPGEVGANDAANGDADVAGQYMAAMQQQQHQQSAAAAAAAAAPLGQRQQQQEQSPPAASVAAAAAAVDKDAGLAAQYMAAMQQQQQQQQQQAAASPPPPAAAAAHDQQQQTPVAPGQQQGQGQQYGMSLSPTSPYRQTPLSQSTSLWQQLSERMGTPNTPRTSQALLPGAAGPWPLAVSVDVIDIEELSFGKLLGAGAEGAVYAAWFLESPVAVKKFERVEDSLHEVSMYLQLGSHDNVVALRGLCQHEGSMYLVLEYCPRGTLDVMLHHSAKRPWDPQKLMPLVRSIARGMHYLHSRNILHRDLKPANIFVGHGQMMKIGDFGMARVAAPPSSEAGSGPPRLRRLTPGTVGTLQYSAPELINEHLRPQNVEEMEWALKLDVWSFGVTLWEILERRRPFEGLSQLAVQAQWMSDPYSGRLPPVRMREQQDRAGKRIHRGLSDLVEDCTRLDPYARPSFRDILLRLKSLAAFAERQESGVLM